MIDLKKPLEGGPGLLLMAVLIFFGAILGVIAAKLFASIKMEGDMANFLGGIMGAALGSAGAVLGAVYIQQREWRVRLYAPTNILIQQLDEIANLLFLVSLGIGAGVEPSAEDDARQYELLGKLDRKFDQLASGHDLPPAVFDRLSKTVTATKLALGFAELYLAEPPANRSDHIRDKASRDLKQAAKDLEALFGDLKLLRATLV